MTTTEPRPTAQTSNPERDVPTRRISFEEALRGLPKHFAEDGDIVGSHLIASLSAVFPDGEDFFVRSVRHYRDQITDPALKRQVTGFIGQEAVHGREHREFNSRLAELGYPTKTVERFTEKGLALRERIAPPASNLAATAALEHFTATLAEIILDDQRARDMIGHPEVANLFLWHALEESEHKAVAFDVYKAIGGSEFTRVTEMMAVSVLFPLFTSIHVYQLMKEAGEHRNWKSWAAGVNYMFGKPGVFRKLLPAYLKFYAPSFHPWNHDARDLVEQAKRRWLGDWA